jgi:CBS domain-containing protein
MSMDQTVLEAKRIGVYTCNLDCKLGEAVRHMVDEDISALVVEDETGCLAGIITRTDLLRAWVKGENWEAEPVEKYMNPNVVTVTEAARLSMVAGLLLDQHIHRVVVVREEEGGKRRPIAVVSSADLVYHMVNVM